MTPRPQKAATTQEWNLVRLLCVARQQFRTLAECRHTSTGRRSARKYVVLFSTEIDRLCAAHGFTLRAHDEKENV